jgi:NTE family protein
MAEKYARQEKGFEWDVIAGVSVGALNAVMLAMERYDRVEEMWRTITPEMVYTGSMNFWSLIKILLGAKSLFGNRPLWRLIQEEVDPDKVKADLRIGAVDLHTGEYKVFRPGDPGFRKAVLASTAIPMVWSPVDVSPHWHHMVDGGVRNVSPLGDVLDADPDRVVVINCNPKKPPVVERPLKNALEIGRHALEIMLNEIFVNDVGEFLRINRNVQEAEAAGVTLHKEDGTPYKYYECFVIEPDEPLGDTLDFSRQTLERSMELGWEKAKAVLG